MDVVWIDGLAHANPDLLAVLGMDYPHAFFSGRMTIIPVADDPAMPVFADSKMVDEMEKQDREWRTWPMEKITDLVRDVHRSAKKVRPAITVSAAVFHTSQATASVLQNWYQWIREDIVDYVIPMAYVEDPALSKAFDEWTQFLGWKKKIIPGLSIYRMVDGKPVPRTADAVRHQIEMCAGRGSDGQVYFCCHYISQELEPVLRRGSMKAAAE